MRSTLSTARRLGRYSEWLLVSATTTTSRTMERSHAV